MSFVLAGLAQGIGQGIQAQAEAKQVEQQAQLDRDFQVALENLRTNNDMATDANRAKLGDQSTVKEYELKDINSERDHKRTLERDENQTTQNIRRDNNSAGNEVRLANVRGAISRQNDEAALKLKQSLESGEVVDTLLDESGEYVGITRTGKRVGTGVFAHPIDTTPRPSAGLGGSALFPELAAGQPAAGSGTAPAAAPAGKTMTRADIQATAEGEGKTYQEAKAALEALGYQLVQ